MLVISRNNCTYRKTFLPSSMATALVFLSPRCYKILRETPSAEALNTHGLENLRFATEIAVRNMSMVTTDY